MMISVRGVMRGCAPDGRWCNGQGRLVRPAPLRRVSHAGRVIACITGSGDAGNLKEALNKSILDFPAPATENLGRSFAAR
jgi:hypothetical protein